MDFNKMKDLFPKDYSDKQHLHEKYTIIREVADAVDMLVMDDAKMQYWRKQVVSAVKKIKTENGLLNSLDGIDPKKDIELLYTILALCHDDHLRINLIITNEIKTQAPLLNLPQSTCYLRRNIYNGLPNYLRYVKPDIKKKFGIREVEVPLVVDEGEWSTPDTKSSFMTKLGIDSYKKFNVYSKEIGIKQVGKNRQLYQLRLDIMDKRNRQKVEKN